MDDDQNNINNNTDATNDANQKTDSEVVAPVETTDEVADTAQDSAPKASDATAGEEPQETPVAQETPETENAEVSDAAGEKSVPEQEPDSETATEESTAVEAQGEPQEETVQSADAKEETAEATAEKVVAEEAPAEQPEENANAETAQEDKPMTAQEPSIIPGGPKARWYVVHTYSGHEAKVAATLKQRVASQKLEDKVLDILVPTQDKIEIREGKKNKIKEKIFPGYLLIKMVLDDNTWLVVRTTPGITSFVGMGNKPTALPDEEVNTIQKYMTMEAPKFKTAFSVGEAVKITDGPFSEFLGSISEIDEEKGKLKVMVSIFGRETPVELDFLQVAKL